MHGGNPSEAPTDRTHKVKASTVDINANRGGFSWFLLGSRGALRAFLVNFLMISGHNKIIIGVTYYKDSMEFH